MSLLLIVGKSSGGSPPPPFDPGMLSGNVLWLDASNSGSITQSGGFVSQWDDLSASAASFAQPTGSLQPAYVASAIGGQPAVSPQGSSNGTHGCLIDAGVFPFVGNGTTPFTLWTVAASDPASGGGFSIVMSFLANAATTHNPQLFFATSDASYKFLSFGDSNSGGAFGVKRSQTSFDPSGTTPYMITLTYDGAGNYAFYSSNVSQTVTTAGADGVIISNSILGANDPTGADPIKYISEMAIYNRVLGSTELGQLQTYGHSKYGL